MKRYAISAQRITTGQWYAQTGLELSAAIIAVRALRKQGFHDTKIVEVPNAS
jgi:hypothetical protein